MSPFVYFNHSLLVIDFWRGHFPREVVLPFTEMTSKYSIYVKSEMLYPKSFLW